MPNLINIQKFTEGNRQAWDASAPSHRDNAEWQLLVDGFADPEFSTLDDTIAQQLIELPVKSKSIVQIGCNNGRELLSTISLGARDGLGIDQSRNFLDQAEELNKIANKDCHFLCSNVYDLPADTPRNYDVALITIGVLNWMPDLRRFLAIVSDLLSTKGKLVIYETHPFLEMFDPASKDPLTPSFSYFYHGPYTSQEAIVYDGSNAAPAPTSYWFSHRLSQIINACIHSGLQIDLLEEHPHSNREVDFDVYVNQKAQLPMCYTLVASKSG